LIFSDGVFEIFREERAAWNLDDCVAYLAAVGKRRESVIDELLNHVQHLRGSSRLDDDFSVIEALFL